MEDYDINYQTRVIEEKKALDEKITKLAYFIGCDVFDKLGETQKELLQNQLSLMTGYSEVLGKRIALLMSGH